MPPLCWCLNWEIIKGFYYFNFEETHTYRFCSIWWSYVPLQKKKNFPNSFLRHAYDIASSYELMHTEFINIKRMLSRKDYLNKQHTSGTQQFDKIQSYSKREAAFFPKFPKATKLILGLGPARFTQPLWRALQVYLLGVAHPKCWGWSQFWIFPEQQYFVWDTAFKVQNDKILSILLWA